MGFAAELDEGPQGAAADQRAGGDGRKAADLPAGLREAASDRADEAFYEWRRREGAPKQPFAIGRADGTPLALAGLWEGWKGADGEVVRSFCILTTVGSAVMLSVHDRMPVILEPKDWPTWLGEVEDEPSALLRPAEEDVLRLWPVSTSVNSVRNNGAELLISIEESSRDLDAAPPGGPNPA